MSKTNRPLTSYERVLSQAAQATATHHERMAELVRQHGRTHPLPDILDPHDEPPAPVVIEERTQPDWWLHTELWQFPGWSRSEVERDTYYRLYKASFRVFWYELLEALEADIEDYEPPMIHLRDLLARRGLRLQWVRRAGRKVCQVVRIKARDEG